MAGSVDTGWVLVRIRPIQGSGGTATRLRTEAAAEDIRLAARPITDSPRWLNREPEEELRMETYVVSTG